jgi:hypothetical protein
MKNRKVLVSGAAMQGCEDLYFDAVSQVEMDSWSRGRVALVGDACFAPSLLSGQGSSFAMAGAYLLAGELGASDGDYEAAFGRHQSRFKPFIEPAGMRASPKALIPTAGTSGASDIPSGAVLRRQRHASEAHPGPITGHPCGSLAACQRRGPVCLASRLREPGSVRHRIRRAPWRAPTGRTAGARCPVGVRESQGDAAV